MHSSKIRFSNMKITCVLSAYTTLSWIWKSWGLTAVLPYSYNSTTAKEGCGTISGQCQQSE